MFVSLEELDEFAFVPLMLTVLLLRYIYGLIVVERIFYIFINLVFMMVLDQDVDG